MGCWIFFERAAFGFAFPLIYIIHRDEENEERERCRYLCNEAGNQNMYVTVLPSSANHLMVCVELARWT